MEQIHITSSGRSTTVAHVASFTSLMPDQSLDKNCIGKKRAQLQDEEYGEPYQMHLYGSSKQKKSEVGSFGLEQDVIEDLNTRLNSTSLIAINDMDTEKNIKSDNIDQPSGTVYSLGPNKHQQWPVKKTTETEGLKKLTNSVSQVVAAETTLHLLPTDNHSARQKIIKSNLNPLVKTFCDAFVIHDSFMILVKDESIYGKPEEREYFLSFACSYGYFELVVVLLALDTDVECRNINDDCTPLMKAATSGFVKIAELLLQHNGIVNASSSTGRTPLMNACAGGHVETVKLLLKYGANLKNHNKDGFTPLMEAVINGHITVVKILLDHGADINDYCKKNQESTLTLACSYGHVEMVWFLLAAGADQVLLSKEAHVEGRGINGDCTPLMKSASSGFVEIVELLLEYGAAINASTSDDRTPLMAACAGGHVETVKLLLKYGANSKYKNKNGYTPLMEAVVNGHITVVKILQEQGACVNDSCKKCQESVLTLVCSKGNLEMVRLLLAAGVPVNQPWLRNKELTEFTPLTQAASHGFVEIAELLLEYGAAVNTSTSKGQTPLSSACAGGHVETVKLLLRYGANVDAFKEYYL